jgi:hypothetical protein
MRTRGRRSVADQAVVIAGTFGKRPAPPAGLTERQAEIWRATVASEHAAFFDTAALRALLTDYCRHRESGEKIASVIDVFQAEWLKNSEGAKRFGDLLRLHELETRAAMMLATKLRITNQSRYNEKSAATAARNTAKGAKPWEV